MFSRIAMPFLSRCLSQWGNHENTLSDLAERIHYLSERGILFEPMIEQEEDLMQDEEYAILSRLEDILTDFAGRIANNYLEEREVGIDHIDSELLTDELDKALFASAPMLVAGHLTARRTSILLNRFQQLTAHPVSSILFPSMLFTKQNKSEVVQIALNSIPIPNDSITWEQIIEYRSDPDSQSKFLALRHWMSEVARAELTPAEVEEKIEYLIDQYQKHMKLHRMKTNTGALEIVLTTGAEALGDLVSFKWGKAAEALFLLKRRQIALLEGELTAPGNEVAYIVKAREIFQR